MAGINSNLMLHAALRIGDKISVLPIIHGSGDCALAVRRVMLEHAFDCVALPLPPSFQADVEHAVTLLPTATMVAQQEQQLSWSSDWSPDEEQDEEDTRTLSYVPIDPCQAVITALRVALGERIAREYIDLETSCFESYSASLPGTGSERTSIEKSAASSAKLPPSCLASRSYSARSNPSRFQCL